MKLPELLVVIYASAFESCERLEKMDFPDTLSSIKMRAFLNCKKLKNVELPNGCEIVSSSFDKDTVVRYKDEDENNGLEVERDNEDYER